LSSRDLHRHVIPIVHAHPMKIGDVEGFEALDHYGIHVVRGKYVDSAEDAIAFASRRSAEDPRRIPIVLCPVGSGTESGPAPRLADDEAIRREYERLTRGNGTSAGRVLARNFVEAGTDVVIAGSGDAADGKMIALRSGAHEARRLVPLGEASAEALVAGFQPYRHRPHDERTRRMLEHLLLRVSEFFEESGVEGFELTVRLHENSYTVIDAELTAPRPLRLSKRLDPHAHDRKSRGYHPAGRQ
jgi:hypothetical protein